MIDSPLYSKYKPKLCTTCFSVLLYYAPHNVMFRAFKNLAWASLLTQGSSAKKQISFQLMYFILTGCVSYVPSSGVLLAEHRHQNEHPSRHRIFCKLHLLHLPHSAVLNINSQFFLAPTYLRRIFLTCFRLYSLSPFLDTIVPRSQRHILHPRRIPSTPPFLLIYCLVVSWSSTPSQADKNLSHPNYTAIYFPILFLYYPTTSIQTSNSTCPSPPLPSTPLSAVSRPFSPRQSSSWAPSPSSVYDPFSQVFSSTICTATVVPTFPDAAQPPRRCASYSASRSPGSSRSPSSLSRNNSPRPTTLLPRNHRQSSVSTCQLPAEGIRTSGYTAARGSHRPDSCLTERRLILSTMHWIVRMDQQEWTLAWIGCLLL